MRDVRATLFPHRGKCEALCLAEEKHYTGVRIKCFSPLSSIALQFPGGLRVLNYGPNPSPQLDDKPGFGMNGPFAVSIQGVALQQNLTFWGSQNVATS